MGALAEVGSSLLLFFLVFGMSATVDIKSLKKAIRNRNAILTGIMLQFVILPFLGFLVVLILNLEAPLGISLLVITSSPGGSYSNWWCSLFNAELALSVTMTTISTLFSIIMLPVNLILYTSSSYSSSVVKSLDFAALFISLVTVIGGIFTGLLCSAKIHSHRFNRIANRLGNLAGISLIIFSAVISSEDHNAQIWDQPIEFYIAVAAPVLLGLTIASVLASYFKLDKPERVAVAVECCYQNTGIATSVAINMFEGDDLAMAVSVPLFYGICEATFLAFYCVGAWKSGWTKAPSDENICVVIGTSYEIEEAEVEDPDAIEVVLGLGKDAEGAPNDLIFNATRDGYQVDEDSLHSISTGETQQEDLVPENDVEMEEVETHDDAGEEQLNQVEAQDARAEQSTPVSLSKAQPGRRRGKKYDSLHGGSPSTETQSVSNSIIRRVSSKDSGDGNSISSGGLGRVMATGVAQLKTRGARKYKKASSAIESDPSEAVEEGEGQNFNFPQLDTPDASPVLTKSTVDATDLEAAIPAVGKTID